VVQRFTARGGWDAARRGHGFVVEFRSELEMRMRYGFARSDAAGEGGSIGRFGR
jgi:hypothetical protein